MQRLEQGELGVTCKAAARATNSNNRNEAVLREKKAISVKRWMDEKDGCEEAVLDGRGGDPIGAATRLDLKERWYRYGR